MSTPYHIILNPESGRGSGRKHRAEVEDELTMRGVVYTLEETAYQGHATELAYVAARRGATTIIAAGGDGTVHEVVNGLVLAREGDPEADAVLGVIPIGTGNDFIKNLTGGTDRSQAYDALTSGEVRRFDLGRVSWDGGSEYFMNAVGTGIDVEVVRQILRLPRLPGVISYLIGLVRALIRFRPLPIRLSIDGSSSEGRVMIAAIGNGFCLGGGFHLFPDAVPDDGLLDLCLVDELSLRQVAVVLPRVLRGSHRGHPQVSLMTATSVVLEALGDQPLFFQIDGELREPPGAYRVEIEIARGVLPAWTARGANVSHPQVSVEQSSTLGSGCSR